MLLDLLKTNILLWHDISLYRYRFLLKILIMFKNHLLTAIRNIQRNKFFSFINFLGLSIGIAAAIIVLTYVFNQKNYDQFHPKKDQVVRLIKETENEVTTVRGLNNSPALAYYGKEHISGIEDYILFKDYDYVNNTLVYMQDNEQVTSFREEKVYFTTGSFFEFFNFKVISGNPAKSFDKPNQMVLTQSIAQKYFQDQNPVGQTMLVKNIQGDFEYHVAGVIEDLPFATHLEANVFLSFPGLHLLVGDVSEKWSWTNVMTYLVLEPNADQDRIAKQLETSFNKNVQSENTYSFSFQPLTDIYLTSNLDGEFKTNSNPLTVQAFTIVAIMLLIIAWVNYINLSSIKAAERYREIGIRKTLGSSRSQIISQFLLETSLFNLLAVILALLLSYSVLPAVSNILSQPINFNIWLQPQLIVAAIAIFAIGTILSGFYAAFIISGYQPIKALGQTIAPSKGSHLRKGLVVFQFMLSIILVSGVLIVYQQVNYMQNKALGINLDDILVINAPPIRFNQESMQKRNTFKNEMLRLSSIEHVSTSSKVPGIPIDWTSSIKPDADAEKNTSVKMIAIDMDYPELYDFRISAGRFYREGDDTFSSGEVLVNQKVLQFLGMENEEEAIGHEFYSTNFGEGPLKIIGVVKDYHHLALKEEITPMLFVYSVWSNYYSVKLNMPATISDEEKGASIKLILNDVKEQYHKVFSEATAFDYFFQDQQFDQQYKSDIQFASMFGMFSSLAIFIALLGLFALSYYYSLRKTKEIGIRKVLGASVAQIVIMLNRVILIPLIFAALLALPLAFLVGKEWLQSYAYRIEVNSLHFIIPIVFVFIISIVVVTLQTLRSATTNPVKALRNE